MVMTMTKKTDRDPTLMSISDYENYVQRRLEQFRSMLGSDCGMDCIERQEEALWDDYYFSNLKRRSFGRLR